MSKQKLFVAAIVILVLLVANVVFLYAGLRPSSPRAASSATGTVLATPVVATPTTTPSTIAVNTPTTVTVTVQITDPTVLTGGVNLLRVNPDGTSTIVGVMHDDGLNGDSLGGDQIYTLRVPFNERNAGVIQLQVSAAFKGLLKRVVSTALFLEVWNVFSSSVASISFAYPPISGAPNPTIVITDDGSIAFDISLPDGRQLPAFIVTMTAGDGASSISDWFNQSIDRSQLLLSIGTYSLINLSDGRAALLLTGGVPNEWQGGPLYDGFVMSSDRKKIAVIEMSQDNPLSSYGVTTQQLSDIVSGVAQTITFN